jgi:hypothetical protein
LRRVGRTSRPDFQRLITTPDGKIVGRSTSCSTGLTIGEFDGRVKYGRLLKPYEAPGDVVWREKQREDRIAISVTRWDGSSGPTCPTGPPLPSGSAPHSRGRVGGGPFSFSRFRRTARAASRRISPGWRMVYQAQAW